MDDDWPSRNAPTRVHPPPPGSSRRGDYWPARHSVHRVKWAMPEALVSHLPLVSHEGKTGEKQGTRRKRPSEKALSQANAHVYQNARMDLHWLPAWQQTC